MWNRLQMKIKCAVYVVKMKCKKKNNNNDILFINFLKF